MKKIEEHIYQLLFLHECVTLPNFGGFVGYYTNARLDKKTGIFTPPSKQINFNKHLIHDDGLLTHHLANKHKITYTEASEWIKSFVDNLKQELESKKRVELAKLGTFFIDNKDNIKFIHSSTNFSTKHFGLPAVVPKKIVKEEVQKTPIVPLVSPKEKTSEKQEDTPVIPIEQPTTKKKLNLWWVAAVLIPIAFYSAWIPMKTDLLHNSKNFHYSDLNPFTYQKIRKYSPILLKKVELSSPTTIARTSTEAIEKVKLDDSTYIWVKHFEIKEAKAETTFVETTFVETTFVETTFVETTTKNISISKKYHLIGGCFSKKENAELLVSQMQELGYSAKILDKNKNLYRVSIGQYSKRKIAKLAKEKLKKELKISSWILKK